MPALLVKKDIKILYSANICGEINILYVTLLTIEKFKASYDSCEHVQKIY